MKSIIPFLLTIFISNGIFSQVEDLGQIEFPNSGSAEAQESFIRGVLLLHSFEYEDAAEEFRSAQKTDRDFALAYWGEAMTYNHPIWLQQDKAKALSSLERFEKTSEERLAKTKSEKEKMWLESIEILYGNGTKEENDFEYEDFMKSFSGKFPDDLEIASFYSLSILGTCHGGRDIPSYHRAAAVAEKIYEINPNHPGALHYIIHSYDDPENAVKALDAANNYSKVAPSASHALHMPTHIFVALGMWEDVVRENIRSANAADARRERKNLGLDARGYHALWWLEYGYLQLGKVNKAREMLTQMHKEALESGSHRTRMHFSVMKAAFLVETDNWSEDVLSMKVDLAGMNNWVKVLNGFLEGYGTIRNNKIERAKSILDDLKKINTGISSFSEYDLNEKEAAIMVSILESYYLFESGKTTEGINLLKKAREAEESLSYSFGPPAIPKPSHEILGEIYLHERNFELAESNFRISLERAPQRVMSLKGLYAALKGLGKSGQAEEVLAEIKKIRKSADQDVYPN
ncbi:MAG TPA: hypothetical protein VGA21_03470 [Cyclobacteriaceae bacterium]|jgi:tetratricopeptide (TPR) repeat protein